MLPLPLPWSDFVITVKHVITGYSADSIRVLFHPGARSFVPHNAQITIRADDAAESDDTDWLDIAIFPLERTLYTDDQFADHPPYPVPARGFLWQPGMDGHFILRGFPHDLSYVDYDDAVLREQAVILEADLTGPSPMRHCYQVKFRDLSPCSDLDGLSGAPVFWVGDGAPRDHRFAGMIVRATYSSGIGHFVHGEVVLTALEKALLA
jgi:hypothetical protein